VVHDCDVERYEQWCTVTGAELVSAPSRGDRAQALECSIPLIVHGSLTMVMT
jgi:hypothetical protein